MATTHLNIARFSMTDFLTVNDYPLQKDYLAIARSYTKQNLIVNNDDKTSATTTIVIIEIFKRNLIMIKNLLMSNAEYYLNYMNTDLVYMR